MNPRRAPGPVLRHHLEDQILNVLREIFPADSISHPGDQAPVHAKACPMPTDHGLRRDNDERVKGASVAMRCSAPILSSYHSTTSQAKLRFES